MDDRTLSPAQWLATTAQSLACVVGIASERGPRERLEDGGFAVVLHRDGSPGAGQTVFVGVCDGVGGAHGGNEASAVGVRTACAYILSWFAERLGAVVTTEMITAALREALHEASEAVWLHSAMKPDCEGAATTGVLAVVHDGCLVFGSVGDSRAYLVRRGDAERLTTDHTKAQRLAEEGRIEPDDVRDHPEANVVTRWLGSAKPPEIAVGNRGVVAGDAVFLVTDGVHGALPDHVMAAIVAGSACAQRAAEALVAEALRRGTTDNATAVCWIDPCSQGHDTAHGGRAHHLENER